MCDRPASETNFSQLMSLQPQFEAAYQEWRASLLEDPSAVLPVADATGADLFQMFVSRLARGIPRAVLGSMALFSVDLITRRMPQDVAMQAVRERLGTVGQPQGAGADANG